MNYVEFKSMIENVKIVDKNLYASLLEKYGIEAISALFERYLNDVTVVDDIDKFNRTKLYIEYVESNNVILDEQLVFEDAGVLDSVNFYLKEIGNIPLLTVEQEIALATKLSELSTKIQAKGITFDDINERLKNVGYKAMSFDNNTTTCLEKKIRYLEKLLNDLKNTDSSDKNQIMDVEELLSDVKLYCDYQYFVDKFMSANLRLVVSIAKRYVGREMEFLDLIQEGNIGLRKAIERFDISKGYKFSTYATWWIRQSITRSIADLGNAIRIPVHLTESINKVRQVEYKLKSQLYRDPTDKEVLEYFREKAKDDLIASGNNNPTLQEVESAMLINESKLNQIRLVDRKIISLYTPIGDDEEDSVLSDFITDTNTSVEGDILDMDLKKSVNELLLSLENINGVYSSKNKLSSKRAILVILLRNGFNLNEYFTFDEYLEIIGDKVDVSDLDVRKKVLDLYIKVCSEVRVYTLEEIGEMLCVTRERIRQIEAKSIRQLGRRARTRSRGKFKEYIDY